MLTLGNIAFQALSLVVLGVFCWAVHRFRIQAAGCLKSMVTFSRTEAAHSETAAVYDGFLGVAMTLGALTAGLAVVKAAAWLLAGGGGGTGTPGTVGWRLAGLTGIGGIEGIPSWSAPVAVIAVALLAVCVAFIEVGVIRAAGGITLSGSFAGTIVRTKKNWMAATSMLTAPLVVLWTGVNPVRDRIITYILITVLVTTVTLFVIHTLRGFVKQKVSLLVWFLYLCTVEIFPVAAVVLAAVKNV